jgi:hypothetical protein
MKHIQPRFNQGWVMLRRGFDFANFPEFIPKLSLVYVYSEKSIHHREVSQEYFDKKDPYSKLFANVPDWMQVAMNTDVHVPPEYTKEVYDGEQVQTYFKEHLTRFYPEEYQSIDMLKYATMPDFHRYYELQKNDEMYIHRKDLQDQIHYLTSRGMSRETAEFYVSVNAKHAVWYRPSIPLQVEFHGWEPCKYLTKIL